MSRVWNKSKQEFEKAEWKKCPRCSGFGSVHGDDDGCHICNFNGFCWVSKEGTGWTRALHRNTVDYSRLY